MTLDAGPDLGIDEVPCDVRGGQVKIDDESEASY